MRNRCLQLLIGVGVIFTQGLVAAALRQSPDAFVVGAAAESALPESCVVDAFVTGAFGGYEGYRRKVTPAKGNEWTIPRVHEAAPVDVLRAYLYCPGFQVETVQVPDLRSHPTHRVDLRLQPLRMLPFEGTITVAAPKDRDRLEILALFSQWWSCEFFRLAECGFSPWNVGTSQFAPDNTFSMQLPDFLADRTIGAAKVPGQFTFVVRDKLTKNILFDLVPVNSTSLPPGFPPRSAYPGEHTFNLVGGK